MTDLPESGLSHLRDGDAGPESCMVDVSAKLESDREALARAIVRFPSTDLRDRALAGGGPKGPIAEVARVAGILAAKRTGELIPMCHPLGLDHVEVSFAAEGSAGIEVRCRARLRARTGVEMEAMTGAAVAALTIYDMVKALDKGIRIEAVELLEKRGGKSGHWIAETGS
ncbi:MAG: cyclic pyranopterin monophosphate synthase MoaC [Planctomycetota bacterium]|nr:cyclic pyranopterin monophosphate synthase MoaC [Planctomycetota bacterium]